MLVAAVSHLQQTPHTFAFCTHCVLQTFLCLLWCILCSTTRQYASANSHAGKLAFLVQLTSDTGSSWTCLDAVQCYERGGGGGGGGEGVCMCAVLQLPHGCEVEEHHSLELVSRRGRNLTAPSCQDIIDVAQQIPRHDCATAQHPTAHFTRPCCRCHSMTARLYSRQETELHFMLTLAPLVSSQQYMPCNIMVSCLTVCRGGGGGGAAAPLAATSSY